MTYFQDLEFRMQKSANHPGARCALLVAHPGHELVIHGFLEKLSPHVIILTDGSGATGQSRVDSTTGCLEPMGAKPTSFYGRYTDKQIYEALLSGDAELFVGVMEEVADLLATLEIDTVVGDAAEGWNPVHDIWRSVVNEAVRLAAAKTGAELRNFDFLLFAPHPVAVSSAGSDSFTLELDDATYRRKLERAEMYAELHAEVQAALQGSTAALIPSPELSRELDTRLQGLSAESYRFELLRSVVDSRPMSSSRVYELYGEMLVARGRYKEAIRYETHLHPVESLLRQHVDRQIESGKICAS